MAHLYDGMNDYGTPTSTHLCDTCGQEFTVTPRVDVDLSKRGLVTVGDLMPGSVMASGRVVETVETGTFRYGQSVHVVFKGGTTGTVGKRNRVWVQVGSVVPHIDGCLF